MKTKLFMNLCVALVLALPAAGVFSQQALPSREGVRGAIGINNGRVGVVGAVMQDDGYIEIDGNRVAFREPDVVITYKGREIESTFLSAGMRIRYRTRDDGSIDAINVIGSYRALEEIDQH